MKLFWKVYSFLFFTIVLSNALSLFSKASIVATYYHITVVFNSWFIIPYLFNALNALLACIACAYLFAYAFDINFLLPAPAWLFYLRLLSECFGHSFEWQMIQASFYQNKFLAIVGLASLIIPIIPSYIAQWRMSYPKMGTVPIFGNSP
jgi:hypothetical protein